MNKKRIGIVAQDSYGILGVSLQYLNWVSQFGIPVILSPDTDPIIDALVLPGGQDVDYKRYSLLKGYWTGLPNYYLEHFDKNILPKLIGRIPIFGICRGLQTLNVVLGGTLRQHLFKHPYSNSPNELTHTVFSKKNGANLGKVNSFHHQCIKNLAPGLTVELVAHDGTIEAISNYDQRIFAVQWHPERLLDTYSVQKFKDILK